MLRRVGIDALMAHKGQPELRIAGLDAVNGAQLAALPGLAKPAARMSFTHVGTGQDAMIPTRRSRPRAAARRRRRRPMTTRMPTP